ncbi:MAG: TetR/AcrR family transcriptional regulator [Candidatus Binatus sp.]
MTPSKKMRMPTRERLLDVAEREFAAHGFAGAKVRRITHQARVNERMLYHYFDSKHGIYRAVLARLIDRVVLQLRSRFSLDSTADPLEELTRAIRAYFDAVAAHPAFPRMVLHEALAGFKTLGELAEIKQLLTAEAIPLLARGHASGSLRADVDPRICISLMVITCLFYHVTLPRIQQLFTEPLGSTEKLNWAREQMIAIFRQGLAGPRQVGRSRDGSLSTVAQTLTRGKNCEPGIVDQK